jgi:hypothetical protein
MSERHDYQCAGAKSSALHHQNVGAVAVRANASAIWASAGVTDAHE